MFYRCKSCGGNVIYDPKKKAMVCESCGNGGEPDLISQEKKHVCNNCGAEIEADKIDLSLKCPIAEPMLFLRTGWRRVRTESGTAFCT